MHPQPAFGRHSWGADWDLATAPLTPGGAGNGAHWRRQQTLGGVGRKGHRDPGREGSGVSEVPRPACTLTRVASLGARCHPGRAPALTCCSELSLFPSLADARGPGRRRKEAEEGWSQESGSSGIGDFMELLALYPSPGRKSPKPASPRPPHPPREVLGIAPRRTRGTVEAA